MREIGSEYYMESADGDTDLTDILSGAAHDAGDGIRFLRCGRDALGFIADEIAGHSVGISRTLFIPALCCDSMVLPFSKRGWNIEYYRLNPDLSADTEHLSGLIDRNADTAPAPVVLVMNYYGITEVDSVKSFLRDRYPDPVIIEDVTHQVFSPSRYMEDGARTDYVIGSIRKWMGVPDGSFVIGPTDMADVPSSNESAFTRLRRQALLEKKDYVFSDDHSQTLKDHFRGLFGEAEDSLEDGLHPGPMSDAAREVLGSVDLSDICAHRTENFTVLRECMSSDPLHGEMYEILNPHAAVPDCPFMLPIVMHIDRIRESSRTAAGQSITRDRFENKLAARGVYAPVLWPIDAQAAEVCEISRRFAQNMLAFYIDHRYDADDMRYVAEVFGEELRAIQG
ncbi:MAG: hypothetical protein IJS12_09575 [Lachnospiraceae bacterium]|nr:hypothetical protein [Lachnospiraceae bacterium]